MGIRNGRVGVYTLLRVSMSAGVRKSEKDSSVLLSVLFPSRLCLSLKLELGGGQQAPAILLSVLHCSGVTAWAWPCGLFFYVGPGDLSSFRSHDCAAFCTVQTFCLNW